MLHLAADLSDAYEYGAGLDGQSNAAPEGAPSEAYAVAPELTPVSIGQALVGLTIPSPVTTEQVLTVTAASLAADYWVGAKVRLGTSTSPVAGYGTVSRNGTDDLRVVWTVPPTVTGAVDGYLIREDFKGASLPNVRVLTPYQPFSDSIRDRAVAYPDPAATIAAGGRRLLAPGFTHPATVTSFDELGVFLPFTLREGVDGFGVSEINDSAGTGAHAPSSVGATSFGFVIGSLTLPNGYFVGGYARLEWEASGVPKLSWAVVTASTGATVTVAAWLGDGTPAAYGDVKRFTVWVPHYNDNPFSFLPGPGFDYPNNDMEPCRGWAQTISVTGTATGTSATGFTDSGAAWEPNSLVGALVTIGSSFGYVANNTATDVTLESTGWTGGTPGAAAYTVSSADGTGSRIHNRPRGATRYAYENRFGMLANYGFLLAHNLNRRVNMVHLGVGATSLVQGSGISGGFPGQIGWWDYREAIDWTPSHSTGLSARYKQMLTVMAPAAIVADGAGKTLRYVCFAKSQGEQDAWSTEGRQLYPRTLPAWVRWLRNAIVDAGLSAYSTDAKIPFCQLLLPTVPWEYSGTYTYLGVPVTVTGDDTGIVNSTIRLQSGDGFSTFTETEDLARQVLDPFHFTGASEVENGRRVVEALGPLVDYALGFGAPVLRAQQQAVTDICNLALSHLGESTRITSLAQGTAMANLCATHFPRCRDSLLQSRQWGFSEVRLPLAAVNPPSSTLYPQYAYCYVVPEFALNPFAVLPPDPRGDYVQTTVDYTAGGLPVVIGGPAIADFHIERAPDSNGKLLFTNQESAVLRCNLRVTDAEVYPPNFAMALSYLLASQLAGPVLKGDKGEKVSGALLVKCGSYARLASTADAQQRTQQQEHIPTHLAYR